MDKKRMERIREALDNPPDDETMKKVLGPELYARYKAIGDNYKGNPF